MAQEWAKAFYSPKKWIRCRTAYIGSRILADGGLCEECREKPGYIVHHKITLTQENISDPKTALNHEPLEYACLRQTEAAHPSNGICQTWFIPPVRFAG